MPIGGTTGGMAGGSGVGGSGGAQGSQGSQGAQGAAGGGGSGNAVVRKFAFAYNTPNLLTGATLYTPTIGDILLDAWVEVDTAWNGTTPTGDIGLFLAPGGGWFAAGDGGVNMADPDATVFLNGLLSGGGPPSNLLSQNWLESFSTALSTAIRAVPAKFVTADPVKVVVSQNGGDTGANPGSTQGAAILYLVTATPV